MNKQQMKGKLVNLTQLTKVINTCRNESDDEDKEESAGSSSTED